MVIQATDGYNYWPTENLAKEITRIKEDKGSEFRNFILSEQTKPISDDQKPEFVNDFLPQIRTLGPDLKAEAKGRTWGGVLYNMFENEKGDTRVIELLVLWTKQKIFVTVFIPIMLFLIALMGIFHFSSVKQSSITQTEYAIIFIGLILSLLGLYYTLLSLIFKIFSFRPLMLIIGLGYLGLSFYDLDIKFHGIWAFRKTLFGMELYIPLIAMVLFAIFIIRIGCKLLEDHVYPGINKWPLLNKIGHDMDYAPLWVFLTKTNDDASDDPGNWKIDRVYYDQYHYFIGTTEVYNQKIANYEIANNWHSFNEAFEENKIPGKLKILTIAVVLFITGLVTIYDWGDTNLVIYQTILFGLAIMLFISFFNGIKRNVLVNIDFTKKKYLMTDQKIESLWNLAEKKAQLIITDKITNPFGANWETGSWSTEEQVVSKKKQFFFKIFNTRNLIRKII